MSKRRDEIGRDRVLVMNALARATSKFRAATAKLAREHKSEVGELRDALDLVKRERDAADSQVRNLRDVHRTQSHDLEAAKSRLDAVLYALVLVKAQLRALQRETGRLDSESGQRWQYDEAAAEWKLAK